MSDAAYMSALLSALLASNKILTSGTHHASLAPPALLGTGGAARHRALPPSASSKVYDGSGFAGSGLMVRIGAAASGRAAGAILRSTPADWFEPISGAAAALAAGGEDDADVAAGTRVVAAACVQDGRDAPQSAPALTLPGKPPPRGGPTTLSPCCGGTASCGAASGDSSMR